MSRIDEIKDKYAKEFDCKNWDAFINQLPNYEVEKHMDDIAIRYATECQDELKKRIVANTPILGTTAAKVVKSILNTENVR